MALTWVDESGARAASLIPPPPACNDLSPGEVSP